MIILQSLPEKSKVNRSVDNRAVYEPLSHLFYSSVTCQNELTFVTIRQSSKVKCKKPKIYPFSFILKLRSLHEVPDLKKPLFFRQGPHTPRSVCVVFGVLPLFFLLSD